MERINITVNKREEIGKGPAGRLRRKGMVPAIVYSKDVNIPVSIPPESLNILRSIHFSESSIINMRVNGLNEQEQLPVLIKEAQFDPVTESIAHIDFLKVSLKEKIKVHIPIAFKGQAKGVKEEGGVLTQILHELEVEGLPLDIPEQIVVDVSELTIGHSIHVADLRLASNIRVLTDANETIVTLVAKEEELEKEEGAVEGEVSQGEPEVIREKKDKESAGSQESKEGKKE